MTTTGSSDASSARPSSTALLKHSQRVCNEGNFASGSCSKDTVGCTRRWIPQRKHILGIGVWAGTSAPLVSQTQTRQMRDMALTTAWSDSQELHLQTQQSPELHHSGPESLHAKVSTSEFASCSGHSPHPI